MTVLSIGSERIRVISNNSNRLRRYNNTDTGAGAFKLSNRKVTFHRYRIRNFIAAACILTPAVSPFLLSHSKRVVSYPFLVFPSFVKGENHNCHQLLNKDSDMNMAAQPESNIDNEALNNMWSEAIEGMIGVPGYSKKVLYLAPKKRDTSTDGSESRNFTKWPEPFLNGRRVFCLTGHNPMGQTLPKEQNKIANLALEQSLDEAIKSSGVTPFAQWNSFGFHVTEGWREDGFALSFDAINADDGRRIVLKLANDYQQAAIYEFQLNKEEDLQRTVVWCNPLVKEEGEIISMKILQDNEIPITELAKGIIM